MTRTGQGSVRVEVSDPGMVLVVQEQARQVARAAGLDAQLVEDAAVVAAELASNAVRHAAGGQVWLVPVTGSAALDVVVADRGEGREDFAACFPDGYTTIDRSLGAGLGAVVRRSASVASCSEAGRGTVVAARVGAPAQPPGVAALGSPHRRETVNGDAWGWADGPDGLLVLVVDGLGHGPGAAAASGTALDALPALVGLEPREAVLRVHERLRGTRGAAVTVARVVLPREVSDGSAGSDGSVVVAGVGNVAAVLVDAEGGAHRMVVGHGTAGLSVRTPLQSERLLRPGERLVLHSDGLTSTWDLRGRPAVLRAAPLVVAGVLLREFERGTDDTAVVVVGAA